MTYEIKARQARCAALGFWPGPIDGKDGPRTRKAYAEACASQAEKGLPFQHPSGITRVHAHWTGGGHKAGALDQRHYHALIEGDGGVIRPNPPITRLAHTLNANSGALAVSICAMHKAVERPFSAGPYPVKAIQLAALARVVAEWCRDYDIPNSRYSILTHAEVQPTLGITQRGKWDVCWIPGMVVPGAPHEVGDRLRGMVSRVVL